MARSASIPKADGTVAPGGIATQVLYVEHASPLPVRVMTLTCFLFGMALSFTAPWWLGRIARRR